MAASRTEACPYESAYAPGAWVTPAQMLAELACERLARSKGTKLPARFWTLPAWGSPFRRQVALANNLLKKYPVAAVLAAFRDREFEWCHSLASPKFVGGVGVYARRLAAAHSPPPVQAPSPPTTAPDGLTKPTPAACRGLYAKLLEL